MAMFRDGGYVVPNAGIFKVENDDEPAEFRHTLILRETQISFDPRNIGDN